MTETVLFLVHSAIVLMFGVFLSAAFSGVPLSPRNCLYTLIFCLLCGGLQLALLLLFSEQTVWDAYPLITHLPTALFLILVFRRRCATALVAVFSSYLFCQPAKWFGIFAYQMTHSPNIEYVIRILCLIAVGFFSIRYVAPCLGNIFTKDIRSILVFGIVPTVYYIFDYATAIYTDFWQTPNQLVWEFLPFFLCITFLLFCIVYYREYERKAEAEQKAQIVRLVADQQAKHMESVNQIDQELRILRHDMRHFLSRLALCIDTDDKAGAKEMMQSYITYIDGTQLTRFCGSNAVNYALSAFATKCHREQICFQWDIQLETIAQDEFLFCSILQNALDNAYDAQLQLVPEQRSIQLLLKYMDDKLLLSVKNPTKEVPAFSDGLPISKTPSHGYGTRSIRYLAEQFGGSCQFSCRNGLFILRVVI